ncbi:probable E3 ubiquitin-protein ligase TRIM8 [Gouania willdenowi]|uniref:Probable E3 ubiquitin-protein ligase TRIM8 n=1 Tax=Gouania willdenowi TaxID=441366 RepID=A0A8C5GVF9_GOUWI|nr:probable E3 ubiquitin-protein ligase TRIM8 [Gouania willdenowi]XP_028318742.1 probable E3 ubiquitin-protein ligase TRIM8 [Gouania willdenowi]
MAAICKSLLEDVLRCPICLDVFKEPIQPPCRHSFCTTCILKAWEDKTMVHCPLCKQAYTEKPELTKNFELANIVEHVSNLSALSQVPLVLNCVLCTQNPPLPVKRVCLCCKKPCCETHIQTLLRQSCVAPRHLLVAHKDLTAWTCPTHQEYRSLYCEEEEVAVCPSCSTSRCTNQRHTVSDVGTKHKEIQANLRRQENKLRCQNQSIYEQLEKLESDQMQIKEAEVKLKRQLKEQHAEMCRTLNNIKQIQHMERKFSSYLMKTSEPIKQLKNKHKEGEHLLSSVQGFQKKAESLDIMKNTKPYQLRMNKYNHCLNGVIPPPHTVNSAYLLSRMSSKKMFMKKRLKEPIRDAPILYDVQSPSSSAAPLLSTNSGQRKRKYSTDLLECSLENANTKDSPSLLNRRKRPRLRIQNPHSLSVCSTGVLPQNPQPGPEHSQAVVVESSSSSRTEYSSSEYSSTENSSTEISSSEYSSTENSSTEYSR